MIEAVIVCDNCADYLADTLPRNLQRVDRLIVVTSQADTATRALCLQHKVDCVLTSRLYADGARFNQGAALNDGFAALTHKQWVLSLDADIVLPGDLHQQLAAVPPKDWDLLFWLPRLQVRSPQELADYEAGLNQLPVIPNDAAIGYFQLFRWQQPWFLGEPRMPENCPAANARDIIFRAYWPMAKWWRLNGVCLHLGENRTNWNGRKSPPWGSKPIQPVPPVAGTLRVPRLD